MSGPNAAMPTLDRNGQVSLQDSRRPRTLTRRRVIGGLAGGLLAGAVLALPVSPPPEQLDRAKVKPMNFNAFSDAAPSQPLRLLFIHHSCGGQWLATPGPDDGENCIYRTAVNGGGLRDALTGAGYSVHEASYGSRLGAATDVPDWPEKFRRQMDDVLRCDRQDTPYSDSGCNDIVVFKSCFTQSLFVAADAPSGNGGGWRLTVANAKDAYRELLPEFRKRPETLFVAVTAPPIARSVEPLYKAVAKRLLRRGDVTASGPLAREFNNWLTDAKNGWLADYDATNVAVFDLYDLLTDNGESNFSKYPTGRRGEDSHPNAAGNRRATAAFVPFLNQAVRRAGLCN